MISPQTIFILLHDGLGAQGEADHVGLDASLEVGAFDKLSVIVVYVGIAGQREAGRTRVGILLRAMQ